MGYRQLTIYIFYLWYVFQKSWSSNFQTNFSVMLKPTLLPTFDFTLPLSFVVMEKLQPVKKKNRWLWIIETKQKTSGSVVPLKIQLLVIFKARGCDSCSSFSCKQRLAYPLACLVCFQAKASTVPHSQAGLEPLPLTMACPV